MCIRLVIPMGWLVLTACGGVSVAAEQAPLQRGRPRLLLRAEKWEGGISLGELRERVKVSPFKERAHLLRTTIANLAMKWMIFDDADAAAAALKKMKRWTYRGMTSEEGCQLIDLALGYDWLFTWSGFGEADKKVVEAKMLAKARAFRDELAGEGAHVFHTRMYAWTAAVGVAGLALHDRHAEGKALFRFAADFYRRRLIPARRIQGGTMHNGLTYGPNYMMFPLIQFLKSARSAAGIDYFHTADPADGAWLAAMADFLIYATGPDLKTVHYGDMATRSPAKHFRFLLDLFAAEYKHGQAAELARRISTRYKTSGYHAEHIYLFLAHHDPAVKPAPLAELPTHRVFSKAGLGHVFWRSGWGADDVMVHFRCGDYFGNHGHFDQGGFTIHRRGDLALKGGCYIGFDVAHRHHYYKQAISTNTVVFSDGPDDPGRQRNINYQHAGTVAEYEARRALVETGNLLAVDDPAWISGPAKGLHTLVADVTPAWDARKVTRFRRHMAFLGGKHLIVVDDTETARAGTRARWLLHTQTKPVRAGDAWVSTVGESALLVRPLLPARPKVTLIGGEGRECEVAGTNYTYRKIEKSNKRKPPAKPNPALGLWRMEIESPEAAARRLFVVVLTADAAGAAGPKAQASVSASTGAVSVRVGEAVVTFHRLGR